MLDPSYEVVEAALSETGARSSHLAGTQNGPLVCDTAAAIVDGRRRPQPLPFAAGGDGDAAEPPERARTA